MLIVGKLLNTGYGQFPMKNMQDLHLAIVGATGAVGREVVRILERRELFPKTIRFSASAKSASQTIDFKGKPIAVEELDGDFFKGIDVAICSAGSSVSQKWVIPEVLKKTIAIDNCGFHRMDPKVPLIVPEINQEVLATRPEKSIIANPNCTTIAMVVALGAVQQHFGIQRIVCSSYQSVSGAGQNGINELSEQVELETQFKEIKPKVFPKKIAFNLIPNIGGISATLYSVEEQKMIDETKKIFGDASIQVAPTCVRVPTFLGHGLSLYVETKKKIQLSEVRKVLSEAPGVTIKDDDKSYPVLSDCQGQDDVFVGRLRPGMTDNSFQLWAVSDNLRKGAALNAIQILESVIKQSWM